MLRERETEEEKGASAVFAAGHVEWAIMLLTGYLRTASRTFRAWSKEKRSEHFQRKKESVQKKSEGNLETSVCADLGLGTL
jgi:hypothetical protein